MKKYLVILLSLCCVLTALFPAAACETEYTGNPPVSVDDSRERPIFSTPRPRPGEYQFYNAITDEAVALSTELYNNFIAADPELFIWSEEGIKGQNYWDEITDEQIAFVRDLTERIVAGCTTNAEEIYAVAEYLAQNVCYDYDCLNENRIDTTNLSAYSVLTNEYTVCSGFAVTYATMMQLIGYPCVYIGSPEHAWNMLYNGERWMLIDVTWMCQGTLIDGVMTKSDRVSMDWYDFSLEQANSQYNHLIEDMPLSIAGGILYEYPVLSAFTEYTLPDGIVTIAEYAFGWCPTIESVDLGDDVVTIEQLAFYGCEALGSISLPDTVEYIGEHAFSWCTALETADLGESVVTIDDGAFYNCNSLVSVNIPNSVTTIGIDAFAFCSSLACADLGNNVVTIGNGAFYACESLPSIFIPASVTAIGDEAFYYCLKLTDVYYGGTQEQWKAIDIGALNDDLLYANIHYNYAPVVLNGLVMDENGIWWYYVDGVLQTDFTGLVYFNGTFFYVQNGMLNAGYTGLIYFADTFYYVENGVLNFNYTGLVYFAGEFYYVEGGVLNTGYTGLIYFADVFYYVECGRINFNYTGLVYCGELFYYVENGILNFGYTGLVYFADVFYYVENGVLNFGYTGLVYCGELFYYVENGALNWNYTGLVLFYDVWYYVNGGILDFGYNGVARTPDGTQYNVIGGIAYP